MPKNVEFQGKIISTGIYKDPVQERVKVRTLNLDGDKQADLTVHGGPEKAVYVYPSEHYPYWRLQFPDIEMDWGLFGENLTTEGLLEDKVNIGDQFEIGSAKFVVTQPRMPCYKLAIKFERPDIIKRFFVSGKPGIYFKVLKEGEVGKGDQINLIHRDENNVTVQDIMRIYGKERENQDLIKRALKIDALAEVWKQSYQKILEI